jgi:hypothetical protein
MAFARTIPKADRTAKGPSKFYTLTVHGGLGFKEASLGIDNTGEQPAAYYQKKLFIPGGLTIKL